MLYKNHKKTLQNLLDVILNTSEGSDFLGLSLWKRDSSPFDRLKVQNDDVGVLLLSA
jgi:hypothetical protein